MIYPISSAAESRIAFHVSFSEPQAHYADIQMEITGINKEYIDVKMPVWTPGSYLVREYARHVESFSVHDHTGAPLEFRKVSKNTWRIFPENRKDIRINYRLYGFEVSVRTNYIDDRHAFLSPAATFMYIDGLIDHPATISITPHASWKHVSTGLEKVEGKEFTYIAQDFDILFDSPIEIGNQEIFTFQASGVEHEVAMVGAGDYDQEKLIRDFTIIIDECTKIFGVNPNKRFVFIVHHFKSGGGGLEHLNSTVLGASRNTYGNHRLYSNFLGLVAHEYFHLWFVKRLRPIELGPFNYDEENYTTALWIMEGFTSYYDNLVLRRTGLVDERAYLQLLAGDFDAVENKPGNAVQPVALASYDAWIKYYRQDENSGNSSISYYNKGALLALLIDVKIIAESNGKHSFDDVLRAAYEEFYVKKKRGFKEVELEELIRQVTGVSVSEIFRMAHTVEAIDYNRYLNAVGYTLNRDSGEEDAVDLGAVTSLQNGRTTVTSVTRGSGAWDGGLNVRDEIISINGNRIDVAGRELSGLIDQYVPGDVLSILIARDGLIRELQVPLKKNTRETFSITVSEDATDTQKQLGEFWMIRR